MSLQGSKMSHNIFSRRDSISTPSHSTHLVSNSFFNSSNKCNVSQTKSDGEIEMNEVVDFSKQLTTVQQIIGEHAKNNFYEQNS